MTTQESEEKLAKLVARYDKRTGLMHSLEDPLKWVCSALSLYGAFALITVIYDILNAFPPGSWILGDFNDGPFWENFEEGHPDALIPPHPLLSWGGFIVTGLIVGTFSTLYLTFNLWQRIEREQRRIAWALRIQEEEIIVEPFGEILKQSARKFCEALLGLVAVAAHIFCFLTVPYGAYRIMLPYPPVSWIVRGLPDDYEIFNGWGTWWWILAGAVIGLIICACHFYFHLKRHDELYDEVKSLRARVSELESRDSPDD